MLLYDVPCSWLTLSSAKDGVDRLRSKEIASLVIDIGLAIVFGVTAMPVMLKWGGWLLCWIGFLYILLSRLSPMDRLPVRTKVVLGALCVLLFVRGFWNVAHSQWRQEQSSVTTGRLVAIPDGKFYPDSDVKFQIGARADGTLFNWTGPKEGEIFAIVGSKLTVKRRNGELLVSTEVRDKQTGTVIVSITDNVWTVSNLQSVVWDKNYTKNALEVKNGRDRVVFQIILLADRVRFQGEWWHEDGNGGRIVRPFPYDSVRTGPVFVIMTPVFHSDEPQIEPMFKYPSKDHWGELADGFTLP